jgi:hypothetical protein
MVAKVSPAALSREHPIGTTATYHESEVWYATVSCLHFSSTWRGKNNKFSNSFPSLSFLRHAAANGAGFLNGTNQSSILHQEGIF